MVVLHELNDSFRYSNEGDGTIWVLANYNRLRTLIDTQGNVEGYNIDLAVGCNGDVVERRGNVFSRRNEKYDPILSILGESSKNGTVIWGGNKLLVKNGSVLKNERGGLNVFVRKVSLMCTHAAILNYKSSPKALPTMCYY